MGRESNKDNNTLKMRQSSYMREKEVGSTNPYSSTAINNNSAGNEGKELLQECFERICLQSMENERLFSKLGRVQQDLSEKTRELEIYKGRCES